MENENEEEKKINKRKNKLVIVSTTADNRLSNLNVSSSTFL